MAGFESQAKDLEALGTKIVAASVDPLDKAEEVAGELSYPVAYGITRDIADWLGSWWEERRGIIQPSEFLIGPNRKILTSTYSSGPIGRIDPEEVVRLITFYESQK